ncbi:filamentous hemagglutinin N-terminal domain-containing protein, partial [Sphingomonas sp. 28-63-12]|uniref:two-partner secretion domain-containing protein n=1 Tax=Sphingomonas sp. 28-63-12 TaxID=1970434 RepID=UPI000BD0B292
MKSLTQLPERPALLRSSFRLCASFSLPLLLAYPAAAQSIADPAVRVGAATFTGLGTNNIQVTQSSAKAVIDWRAFSVDAGSTVSFAQPNANAIALNRITGLDETRIDGSLVANGQVWLLNPNGVLIGGAGRVSAGGFLATTHALSNEDFIAGRYGFDGSAATGSVINYGQITTAQGGYAVLAGNKAANAGLVMARLGKVVLGVGKGFVLDLAGDKLLSFSVTQPLELVATSGALVENAGALVASGGDVLLTARSASDVIGGVINTSGVIDATSVGTRNGQIVLDGGTVGTVVAGGLIDASGMAAGETGGAVKIFGRDIIISSGALVNARGDAGGGTINVGGGWQGAAVDGYSNAVRTALLSHANLDASANTTGDGGTVTLWSDANNGQSMTIADGGIFARGGSRSGNGGRIETSGHYLFSANAYGSAAAANGLAGTWLFDPYNVEIVAAGTASGSSIASGIVNPGFEDGFTGWYTYVAATSGTASGTVQTVTSANFGGQQVTSQVSPSGNFALFTANLVANSGNNYAYGIAYQDFQGVVGDKLNVYFNTYLDNANFTASGGYSDGYFYLYDFTGGQYVIVDPHQNTSTMGWVNYDVTLATTGQYQIYSRAYISNGSSNTVATSVQTAFEIGSTGGSPTSAGGFADVAGTQVWTPTGTGSKIDAGQITGFLNAGTNVQITTGSAGTGSEAGNITVNAAIAKTSGATASLQLDAANAIVVNQAISSSSNALNVILNAGAGGITLGAGVNTNSGA